MDDECGEGVPRVAHRAKRSFFRVPGGLDLGRLRDVPVVGEGLGLGLGLGGLGGRGGGSGVGSAKGSAVEEEWRQGVYED